MKYILVVGSRSFNNYTLMEQYLDKEIGDRKDITIISGGAKGADTLAIDYAKSKGIRYKVYWADWNQYGKRAEYIRNELMHSIIAQKEERKVLAFWDGQSKGTKHSFELAQKYKNEIDIIRTY